MHVAAWVRPKLHKSEAPQLSAGTVLGAPLHFAPPASRTDVGVYQILFCSRGPGPMTLVHTHGLAVVKHLAPCSW